MTGSKELAVRLLGPVTCTLGDDEVDVGAPRQQAVLVMLVSSPGQVVTMARLLEGLWGEDPPSRAEQSVYTYVAGLRRALEPGRAPGERPALLIGGAGGYRLAIDPGQVDVTTFARLVAAGRRAEETGAPAEAARLYDQALDLWQGSALSGVPGPYADTERARLDDLYVAASEGIAAARIRLGDAEKAVPGLRSLVRLHPLRERPHELLMLALDAVGRRPEALRVYEEARRVLAEELGVGPGEGLRKAYALVSPSDGPVVDEGPAVPRQLPRDLIGFVGRAQEVIRLKTLLAPWDDRAPHPLVVISGPPGVGKSALAVHIAHAVKERFPGGQVYVNLRGGTPHIPRLGRQEIAARLLRAIGTPNHDIPADPDEAAALWHTRLHDKKLLVLLDDAADLAQIRPFLAVPLGVSVLVTSRESLIMGDDCVQLKLARLSQAESATMLAKLAGAHRVSADLAETASLVRLCDGLPLALRIAGARLADRPDWSVGSLTSRLTDERTRLRELEAGDLAVRSGLAASWSHLTHSDRAVDRRAADMLALLGLVHLPDIAADVAARLAGVPFREAERALDRLGDAHLLDRGTHGRYQLHDLVRLFAGELLPAEERKAPLMRVFAYYAASMRSATRTADPNRVQALHLRVDDAGRTFRDADEANAWVEEEEAGLLAAAAQAMADADDDLARLGAAIGLSLLWHQQKAYRVTDLIATGGQALSVAVRLKDDITAMHAHSQIGAGEYLRGDFVAALQHLELHLSLARRLNDRFNEQRAFGNLAATYVKWEKFEQARESAIAQREIAREIASEVGERYALLQLGTACRGLGRLDEAAVALEEAGAMAERAGDSMHEAHTRCLLGQVQLDRGNLTEGLAQLEQALAHARTAGAKVMESHCLIQLARANRLLSRLPAAKDRATEAVSLAHAMDSAYWLERAAAELEALEPGQEASRISPGSPRSRN